MSASRADEFVATRLPWDRAAALRAAIGTLWIVVNRLDGTSTTATGKLATVGRDAPDLGDYDEWFLYPNDPGPLASPLPSFVNDGGIWLLVQSPDEFGPQDRDLAARRDELAIEIDHTLAVSNAVAIVWALEELLIVERPELGLAVRIENGCSNASP